MSLAVTVCQREVRGYLRSSKSLDPITVHRVFRYSLAKKDVLRWLERWAEIHSRYDFQVVHRPGVEKGAVDLLSRQNLEESALKLGDHDRKVYLVILNRPYK